MGPGPGQAFGRACGSDRHIDPSSPKATPDRQKQMTPEESIATFSTLKADRDDGGRK
jgi:hypothetical protein